MVGHGYSEGPSDPRGYGRARRDAVSSGSSTSCRTSLRPTSRGRRRKPWPPYTGRFRPRRCDERRAEVRAIFLHNPAQERHSPGRSIDAVIGWRLVKQSKNSPAQILVVDFAVRFGLGGKHKFGTLTIEHVSIFADKGFADAKKCANRSAWDFSPACEDYHGAVAHRQATVVEVLKQNGEVWNIAQLAMESVLV